MVEGRIRRNIKQNNLIKYGDRIAVAVSGGKDSVTCLYTIAKLRDILNVEVIAISVDEGIKGYREESLKFARKAAKKLKVEHKIASFKKIFGYSLDEILQVEEFRKKACTFCGVFRRRCINMLAKEVCADKVATGHNLDDEIQAIMMNYIKGNLERLRRLGPITLPKREGFVQRIKPLRLIPEKEVALYALLKGYEVYNGECPYIIYAFRHSVRQMINWLERKHPGIKFSILGTYDRLKPLFGKYIKINKLKPCKICGEPTAHEVCKVCSLLKKIEEML